MNTWELSDNQYFYGLNRRFDKRMRQMKRFGFVQYKTTTNFVNPAYRFYGCSYGVLPLHRYHIMHMSNRCWFQALKDHMA